MGRATDPIVEKVNKGNYEITTTRQGWFDTASYKVEVRVVDRETKKTVTATNETQTESPRSVRKRALAQMNDMKE